jgi:sulfonate dioxygenase
VTKLTPVIGTEIRGLQLSALSDVQKDELALLIAERGVVVFRDQDFKDISIEKQKEFGRYFGPLHVHVCCPCSIQSPPSPPLVPVSIT